MTKRDYFKYNWEVHDMQGNVIRPGDTVVVNNNYSTFLIIGIADHMTESKNLAINYVAYQTLNNGNVHAFDCHVYRSPEKVLKIKDGNKSDSKN